MKFILSFLAVGLILVAIFLCGGQKGNRASDEFLRIHVVANSNSTADQNMKYYVKDEVVNFLIPLLKKAQGKTEAEQIVFSNLAKIEEVANKSLRKKKASYGAKIEVKEEKIPARCYGNLVLAEGVYDSLVVKLGEGKGDNWWCIVFPAICFLDSKNCENYVYISKIWGKLNYA